MHFPSYYPLLAAGSLLSDLQPQQTTSCHAQSRVICPHPILPTEFALTKSNLGVAQLIY
jgi:hypothetical protein